MQKAFLCNRKKRAKLLSDSVELTQMIQGNSGMIMSVARLKVSFRASKKKNRKSIKKQFTWHGMVWYFFVVSSSFGDYDSIVPEQKCHTMQSYANGFCAVG